MFLITTHKIPENLTHTAMKRMRKVNIYWQWIISKIHFEVKNRRCSIIHTYSMLPFAEKKNNELGISLIFRKRKHKIIITELIPIKNEQEPREERNESWTFLSLSHVHFTFEPYV